MAAQVRSAKPQAESGKPTNLSMRRTLPEGYGASQVANWQFGEEFRLHPIELAGQGVPSGGETTDAASKYVRPRRNLYNVELSGWAGRAEAFLLNPELAGAAARVADLLITRFRRLRFFC